MGSRTKNSITNVKYGIIGQIIQIICQFVCRTIFVHTLSADYLGLNGLFTNILSVLSLAELGFGSAITYSLYAPLAVNNNMQIKKIMNLYRLLYRVIAVVVALLGVCIVPFLQYFVKDAESIPNIKLLYLLYLSNSVASYLLIYKKSLIDADQKKYIGIKYQKGFSIIQNGLQIAFLLLTHNYIVYLLIQIIASVLCNICISIRADSLYPVLKEHTRDYPDREEIWGIAKNTFAMSIHRIGNVVVNNTDNLIISSFVSLASVGIYSNYQLIVSNLNIFTNLIFDSFTASVGNLNALEGKQKLNNVFEQMMVVGALIYGYISTCLISLFNPFIRIWLGKEYTFNIGVVIVIVLIFYLNGIRNVIRSFRDALGLFWYDRYKPIFESIINLVFSLILVKKMGILGVFIGTVISNLTVCFWVEPYVLYKYGLKNRLSRYFIIYFKYFVVACISTIMSFLILKFWVIDSLGKLFLAGIINSIIYALIGVIFCYRDANFIAVIKRVIGMCRRKVSG